MRWLVLAFLVLPVVDLWLLLSIGDVLGFWPTLGLTVGVAVLGGYLGKREGLRVLSTWRSALGELRMPEEGIVSGALVLVGAALLISPGVLTDVIGILLMIPFTRRPIAAVLRTWLAARMERAAREGRLQVNLSSSVRFTGSVSGPGFGGVHAPDDDEDDRIHARVIDTEGEVVDDDPAPKLLPPKS